MKTIKLKINIPMQGYAAGREISIEADRSGVPLDKFWRRRLKDAEIDDCVCVVKNRPKRDDTKSSIKGAD